MGARFIRNENAVGTEGCVYVYGFSRRLQFFFFIKGERTHIVRYSEENE